MLLLLLACLPAPCPDGATEKGDQATHAWCEDDQGRKHGPERAWHAPEKPRLQAEWREGKRHGPWREWAADGALILEQAFVDDVLHGPSRRSDDDGKPIEAGSYAQGKKHGIWTTWTDAGRTELAYEAGALVRSARFDANGDPIQSALQGEGPTTFASNGELLEEGTLVAGLRQGEWKTYDAYGRLAYTATWAAGQHTGEFEWKLADEPYATGADGVQFAENPLDEGVKELATLDHPVDRVLAVQQGGLFFGGGKASLVRESGKVEWTVAAPGEPYLVDDAGMAVPMADGSLVRFARDGTTETEQLGWSGPPTRAYLDSDHWVFAEDRALKAVEEKTGVLTWQLAAADTITAHPMADDDIVVFGDASGTVYRVQERDGQPDLKRKLKGKPVDVGMSNSTVVVTLEVEGGWRLVDLNRKSFEPRFERLFEQRPVPLDQERKWFRVGDTLVATTNEGFRQFQFGEGEKIEHLVHGPYRANVVLEGGALARLKRPGGEPGIERWGRLPKALACEQPLVGRGPWTVCGSKVFHADFSKSIRTRKLWTSSVGWNPGSMGVHDQALVWRDHQEVGALDLVTGRTRWKMKRWSDPAIANPVPLVHERVAYVPAADGLKAIALRTGEELWTAPIHQIRSVEPGLFVATKEAVVAVDPLTGQVRWSHPAQDPSIVLAEQTVLVKKPLQALQMRDGSVRWSSKLSARSLTVDDGLFVVAGEKAHRLDLATGEPMWSTAIPAREGVRHPDVFRIEDGALRLVVWVDGAMDVAREDLVELDRASGKLSEVRELPFGSGIRPAFPEPGSLVDLGRSSATVVHVEPAMVITEGKDWVAWDPRTMRQFFPHPLREVEPPPERIAGR